MNDDATISIVISANHPALTGHFPGKPVVPAVVMLDAVLAQIRTHGDFVLRSIPATKFLQPVLPEERVELHLQFDTIDAAQLRVGFRGLRADALVFEGSFIVSAGSGP